MCECMMLMLMQVGTHAINNEQRTNISTHQVIRALSLLMLLLLLLLLLVHVLVVVVCCCCMLLLSLLL